MQKFTSSLCAFTFIFLAFISKKDSEKGVTFKIFYLPSQTDTHSAHAELKLSLFVAYKSIDSYLKVQFMFLRELMMIIVSLNFATLRI